MDLDSMDLNDKLAALQQFLDEHRREGGLKGNSYPIALILLTAARLGPDIAGIAAQLGLDETFVQTVNERMRYSGLWADGYVSTEGWFDDEAFPLFYEDLAVAEGLNVCFRAGEQVQYLPARFFTFQVM